MARGKAEKRLETEKSRRVAFETRSSEETVEKESPADNSPVPLEYAGGARNRCSTDPDTVVALWRTLATKKKPVELLPFREHGEHGRSSNLARAAL